ncbi:MAG: CHAT domain-containing protein [Bacteroidota bacterium]
MNRIRWGLLLASLTAGTLVLTPTLSPAQSEDRGSTPGCIQDAGEMDVALSESLADGDAALRTFLVEVRERYIPHRGREADCAASLGMNEIVALLLLDDIEETEAALSEYSRLYKGKISPNEWVDYHLNRGFLLSRLGQTQASTEEYSRAAAMAADLPPYRGITAYINAALTFAEVQDPVRARTYLRLADSLAQANLDSVLVRESLGEIQLEQALTLQRQIDQGAMSSSAFSEVRRLAESALTLYGDSDYQSPERAMAQITIARALLAMGDETRASDAIRDAIPTVNAAASYAGYVVVERWMTEGDLAEATGDLSQARVAFERALASARDEVLPNRALDALLALGRIAEADGANATARDRYEEAIALGETIRQRQGLQDWSLSASEQTAQPYARLAALLARSGDADSAFQMLDASRARRLFDLRASLQARVSLESEDRLRVDSLLDALDGVRLALPSAPASERAALDAEATRIQRILAETSGLELEPPPDLDLVALTDTLASRRQVLVSYLLGDDASWAFLVSSDGVSARELPTTTAEIREAKADISSMWREGEGDAMATDPEFQIAALERLYTLLVDPIRDAIPEGAGIVTIPPADLATIPFGMLVEPGGPTDDYRTAQYLVREHPVSTELAAALLVTSASGTSGGERLVFGRTEFEDQSDLPFVGDEARRVRRALPSSLFRLDEDATEAALLEEISEAGLIHLASHAAANPEFPLYSQITLTDDPAAPDDGTLHLYELESRPLNADLVVLSGCSTARGRALRGEGMIGMQYGVRAAGAKSALATLWPVDDRATVEIMGGFYDGLADGLSKDRALQNAQIQYLASADEIDASPFYWAPAVLSGGIAPAPWETPSRFGFWLALFAGLALTGSVAWVLTQRRRRV